MTLRSSVAFKDDRLITRDEVHYRARGTGPDGRPVSMLIVNMSAMGLMARTEAPLVVGDRVRLMLPVIGSIDADIRWALGGRVGCELGRTIDLADYYELLAIMLKAA
jgi:hypothetical protein